MSFSRYGKQHKQTKFFELDTVGDDDPMAHVIAEFKYYIDRNTKGKKRRHSPKRAYELHPSSFPYCGLQHWFKIMKFGGVDEWQELDFNGDFYTSNGTTTHELIQEWLGKGKKLVGNWTCKDKKCKGKRKFSVYKPCPKCDGEMAYHELGVKFGKFTTGHLDGLFFFEEDGKYYVIDYKTCGFEAMQKHLSGVEKIFPYSYNVAQIESYCYYLEKQYKIKIGGWMLVYLTRDAGFRKFAIEGKKFSGTYRQKVRRKCKLSDKHFGIAIEKRKVSEIKTLIEEKPCDCKKTYMEEYHNKYEPCPLMNVCFNPMKLKSELKKVEKEFILKQKSGD